MSGCERCEERERQKKILDSQKGCKDGHCSVVGEPEIVELNRIVKDQVAESVKIDSEIKKRHTEAINGYDKQIEDGLIEIHQFSTKMFMMFEDYRKKGDVEGMAKILKSIYNYALLTGSSAHAIALSAELLIEKVANHSG